jgi:hypothetical protein
MAPPIFDVHATGTFLARMFVRILFRQNRTPLANHQLKIKRRQYPLQR